MNSVPEEGSQGRGNKGVVFAYGHDSKKFRLRAVSAEKDAYSKFISKPIAKKVSVVQFGLAILICIMQIVTMGIVTGRYSYYDTAAGCGAGIWTSFISAFAAVITGWCARTPRYWKLHVAFALHIVNIVALISLSIMVFGGSVSSTRYRLGEALYGNSDGGSYNYNSDDKVSVPMLATSLVLNSLMGTATLAQLVSSFVMSLMTARALCCGQAKIHGKVFELEMAGSENSDGVVVVKKSAKDNENFGSGNDIPPTYQEAQVV